MTIYYRVADGYILTYGKVPDAGDTDYASLEVSTLPDCRTQRVESGAVRAATSGEKDDYDSDQLDESCDSKVVNDDLVRAIIAGVHEELAKLTLQGGQTLRTEDELRDRIKDIYRDRID